MSASSESTRAGWRPRPLREPTADRRPHKHGSDFQAAPVGLIHDGLDLFQGRERLVDHLAGRLEDERTGNHQLDPVHTVMGQLSHGCAKGIRSIRDQIASAGLKSADGCVSGGVIESTGPATCMRGPWTMPLSIALRSSTGPYQRRAIPGHQRSEAGCKSFCALASPSSICCCNRPIPHHVHVRVNQPGRTVARLRSMVLAPDGICTRRMDQRP